MRIALPLVLIALVCSCSRNRMSTLTKDIHSFSNPTQIAVRNLDLDLAVSFDERKLKGSAVLWLEQLEKGATHLVLDSRDLDIAAAETSRDNSSFQPTKFTLGSPDKILGRSLTVETPPGTRFVRIRYSTVPEASGLQWLTPQQTAGKAKPFLFSQNEPIAARSWIPLQDSPGIRITYTAKITVPAGLTAVMAAEHDRSGEGVFHFHVDQSIPSYLIALAVGDIAFESTGHRTGVYAEPSVVKRAAKEFEDTEKMLEAAELLFGPYRWGRYDLLVLPPSFPFGGMENPMLTFATPTVLAGDKSLVSLVAHEMAHSWSGNLVTNATWSDFWLNEGFTVYCERRIVESVYGKEREEMEAQLGRGELKAEMLGLPAKDTVLHIDLANRDPDDGMTLVPYEKGYLMLRQLEEQAGRDRFDKFLQQYFDRFAFQSITTAQAMDFLRDKLGSAARKVPIDAYLNQPGIPAGAPDVKSAALAKVATAALHWPPVLAGSEKWSTQERLYFLRALPPRLTVEQMESLDKSLHLTESGNDEILDQWLLMSIANNYRPADGALDRFLLTVGRRKLIKPLYAELMKTPEGKVRAKEIYARARAGYHPMAQSTMDTVVRTN